MDTTSESSSYNIFPQIRQPSRVRMVLFILLFVILVIAIVFVALYAHEKNDNSDDDGGNVCEIPSCVISAGGRAHQ